MFEHNATVSRIKKLQYICCEISSAQRVGLTKSVILYVKGERSCDKCKAFSWNSAPPAAI